MSQLNTLTLLVDTAASIAEVFAASALHMVTTLGFFDPKFAERTHLILGTFHQLLKGLLVIVRVGRRLMFSAGKASVLRSPVLETIRFLGLITSEVVAIYYSVIDESLGAAHSRALLNIILNSISLGDEVLFMNFYILW